MKIRVNSLYCTILQAAKMRKHETIIRRGRTGEGDSDRDDGWMDRRWQEKFPFKMMGRELHRYWKY